MSKFEITTHTEFHTTHKPHITLTKINTKYLFENIYSEKALFILLMIGLSAASPQASAADDTISVVTQFYQALSNADGDTAESLVIVNKQGKGPFKSSNITRFYGHMENPLRVKSVDILNEDSALVTYTYVANGRPCNGKAKVYTTISKYGERLINRIDANC